MTVKELVNFLDEHDVPMYTHMADSLNPNEEIHDVDIWSVDYFRKCDEERESDE